MKNANGRVYKTRKEYTMSLNLYNICQEKDSIEFRTKNKLFSWYDFTKTAKAINQALTDLAAILPDSLCFSLTIRTRIELAKTEKQAKKYAQKASRELFKILQAFPKDDSIEFRTIYYFLNIARYYFDQLFLSYR